MLIAAVLRESFQLANFGKKIQLSEGRIEEKSLQKYDPKNFVKNSFFQMRAPASFK